MSAWHVSSPEAGATHTFTMNNGTPQALKDILSNTDNVLQMNYSYNGVKSFAGWHYGKHSYGSRNENFSILICYFDYNNGYQRGSASETWFTTKTGSFMYDFVEVGKNPKNESKCSVAVYSFTTMPDSEFDPLASSSTASFKTNYWNNQLTVRNFSQWKATGKSQVVVKLALQIIHSSTKQVARLNQFEIIIKVFCEVTQPATMFSTGLSDPFGIDVSGLASQLVITLTPYTNVNTANCGALSYDFTVTPFDAIGQGHATVDGNKVTFNDINQAGVYPIATALTVTFKVKEGTKATYDFEESFQVNIVDCLQEAYTIEGEAPLKDSELELTFPLPDQTKTFAETWTFNSAAAKQICTMHEYRITCQDNQLDLQSSYPTSLYVSQPSKTTQYQNAVTLLSESDPCNKFTIDASMAARIVRFSEANYPAMPTRSNYEGEYLLTGQPLHESNTPYPSSLSFKVKIKLNCDEVVILEPAGKLQFTINIPPGAPQMPNAATVLSDDLYYWQRSTASYPLHGEYVNPNPYSCTLQQNLCETNDQSTCTTNASRSNSNLLIDLDTSSAVPVIKVSSTANRHYINPKPTMMYEASLQGSTSRKTLVFKYFIFVDCTDKPNEDELVAAQETINGVFQIDGSSSSQLVKTLTQPVFKSSFTILRISQQGCPMQLRLDTKAQKSADLSTAAPSSNYFIDSSDPSSPKLVMKFKSNTQLQTYQHPADILDCDLSVLGTRSCDIEYWVNAMSTNGTVAIQSRGVITVKSECLYIETRYLSASTQFWWKSKASQASYDVKLSDGYEIRDPKQTFELPQFKPTLASGDDIFTQCGDMTYTIQIQSAKPGPYTDLFTMNYAPKTVYDSATVSIETDDQSYALHSGVANGDYRTLYEFQLTAVFDTYSDLFSFSYNNVPFYIFDYCAALILDETPPLITPITYNKQTITQGFLTTDSSDPSYGTKKWVNMISKNLMSETSIFELGYMSYIKWCPPLTVCNHVLNQGCGKLNYNVVEKSWLKTFEDDMMTQPEGNDFFGHSGTVHLLEAENRKAIGNHFLKLEVKSDFAPISTAQNITFEIEILDCKVKSLLTGDQEFKDVEVKLDEIVTFPIAKYQQTPKCGFRIDYTVTLFQKPYGSTKEITFTPDQEGWQPEPPFVTIYGQQINIAPKDPVHEGSGYAVFIKGNLNVNATVQGPMSALSDQFDIQVPESVKILKNSPPMLSGAVETVSVFPNVSVVRNVGTPYDMQLDDFWIQEWGPEGLDDREKASFKSWVKLVNITIEEGIKFKIEPRDEHKGKSYTVGFVLVDAHPQHPMQIEYKFNLVVLGFNFGFRPEDDQEDEKNQNQKKPEIVRVSIDAPDNENYINIRFSKYIKLPSNATLWTNENEGAERIDIKYIPSETTQTLIYDQDLFMKLSWQILDANVKGQQSGGKGSSKRRALQRGNQDSIKILEINQLMVKLNFTEPQIVSRQNYDSISVQVLPDMFHEETILNPKDQVQYIEMNSVEFSKKSILPQQHDPDVIALAEQITQSSSNMLTAFVSTNLALSLVSAGALQYLWGLLNSMQMIVLSALFRIDVAINANMIMIAILKMVSLDFIDTDSLLVEMFGYRETPIFESFDKGGEELESKYGDASFDSSNYIMLLGPLFFIILLYLTARILLRMAKFVCKRCSKNCLAKFLFRERNQKIVILRFVLEGCVDIGLSAMISVVLMSRETWSNPTESATIVFAFISLLILLLAPIYLIKLIREYHSELKKPSIDQKLNPEIVSLFEDYRKKALALGYPVVFFMRRYAIILILTLMPRLKYAQIFGHLISTGIVVSYLFGQRPYYIPSSTIQEGINECIVLLAGYPLLVFTNWIGDENPRIQAGWAIVACIVFIVIFNIFVLLFTVCRSWLRKCRFKCIRSQRLKEFKKAVRLKEQRRLKRRALRDQTRLVELIRRQQNQQFNDNKLDDQFETTSKQNQGRSTLSQLSSFTANGGQKLRLKTKQSKKNSKESKLRHNLSMIEESKNEDKLLSISDESAEGIIARMDDAIEELDRKYAMRQRQSNNEVIANMNAAIDQLDRKYAVQQQQAADMNLRQHALAFKATHNLKLYQPVSPRREPSSKSSLTIDSFSRQAPFAWFGNQASSLKTEQQYSIEQIYQQQQQQQQAASDYPQVIYHPTQLTRSQQARAPIYPFAQSAIPKRASKERAYETGIKLRNYFSALNEK